MAAGAAPVAPPKPSMPKRGSDPWPEPLLSIETGKPPPRERLVSAYPGVSAKDIACVAYFHNQSAAAKSAIPTTSVSASTLAANPPTGVPAAVPALGVTEPVNAPVDSPAPRPLPDNDEELVDFTNTPPASPARSLTPTHVATPLEPLL